MTHAHHHCTHQLQYCKPCDIAYCSKCHREWGVKAVTWSNPYLTTTTTTADATRPLIVYGETHTFATSMHNHAGA